MRIREAGAAISCRNQASIRNENMGGSPTQTAKRRSDNLFRYVLNDGSFPVAPVVMRRPEGLSPIGGTHRMAVVSAFQLLPEANFARRNW